MKQWGRTLRVGIVVGMVYFAWYMRDFFRQNWNFKLFSTNHWSYVWREFENGWIIKATSDWIFALTILLMIPVFCILWWVSVKISWRKSLKTVWRKIKQPFTKNTEKKVIQKKIKIKAKSSHKKIRPKPIASLGRPPVKQTGRTMDAEKNQTQPTFLQAEPLKQTQQPQPEQPIFLDENIENIPLNDIQLPERMRLEEDLVAILSGANYQVVKDVTVGQLPLGLVGISNDKVVLCLMDVDKGDWLADEEFFNEEEPLWFSETAHRTSPVYRLLTEAKNFAKKMASKGLTQSVVPILIEKEGTIINANDMMETWKKMNVIVCRTDLGGPEELPSFAEALPPANDRGSEADLNGVRDLF
ncbi:MAG: hypothetical protein SPL08_04185 [Pseudomonadota bacterium]|nr:hypothetical protein [Pseudomonadota bacterium]